MEKREREREREQCPGGFTLSSTTVETTLESYGSFIIFSTLLPSGATNTSFLPPYTPPTVRGVYSDRQKERREAMHRRQTHTLSLSL